jgi:hypothetical protein
MDEKALSFNENQLKRTGFAEAFTPELKAKMEQGLPEIKHPFKKAYDGNQVEAILHLKKSATSDFYFLNKFDLQLQKEGQANAIKQTFYLTQRSKGQEAEDGSKQRLENKYTLKEGYNLLAGRPVFKDLVNQEGQAYQAWVKLNFKNQLNNGNHEMKQYHTNYGFDLEKTLSNYPIKELANPQYKQSLVDSLQRGNLQKATFVGKDGKEEKLYISPNITFGSLNVYDQNKQRMPTEALVEKQFIGYEFSQQLNERMKQQQKIQDGSKQEQLPSQNGKEQQITAASGFVDPRAQHQAWKMAAEEKIDGPKIVPGAMYLADPKVQQQGKTIIGERKQALKQKEDAPVKKQRPKHKLR